MRALHVGDLVNDPTETFDLALTEAARFRGATSPNPPVGAVLLDTDGRILSIGAHERAGTSHAEVVAIERAKRAGLLDRAHTLVVTLEPCNHHGRTPPCTEAILATPIKRVYVGTRDPNTQVSGGGAERLKMAGRSVTLLDPKHELAERCRRLIEPFATVAREGRAYLTLKQALRQVGESWTSIPPEGQRTFTRADSLTLAHELRRRADAILTGSGTILADQPEFTVRRVPDHPGKVRTLVIFDRRGRVPTTYAESARERGFQVRISRESVINELKTLAREGCLEALLEAGPELTRSVYESGIWDESMIIRHGETRDEIEHVYRHH